MYKEKTHNIRRGGGCVRVSGRDGTDRCVRDTQNKKGGERGVCICQRSRSD